MGVTQDLLADGNSVVLVDHDVQLLREADWLIEIGPGSGADGGHVITTGTIPQVSTAPGSVIGGFLSGAEPAIVRDRATEPDMFAHGTIGVQTSAIHTFHALNVAFTTTGSPP